MIRVLLALLRPLARLARAQEASARQLKRLADHFEGVHHNTPSPELPTEPPTLVERAFNPQELALAYQIEQGLTAHLGRPPSEDEIIRELDGLQTGPDDLKPEVRARLGL